MKKETEKISITIYTESLLQSILADTFTFLMLSGMFYVNAVYIQSRLFAAMIVFMFVLKGIIYVGGRKNVYTSRDAAIQALNDKK